MAEEILRREIVGLFSEKAAFDACVKALLDAGFDHSDISLLSSHEALDATYGEKVEGLPETAKTALDVELTYAFPLATAGLVAIVGGPVTALLGGIVAAGVAGMAVKDYIEALVVHPKPGDFARALEAGGVILWVYAASPEREETARKLLEEAGAANIHTAQRKD